MLANYILVRSARSKESVISKRLVVKVKRIVKQDIQRRLGMDNISRRKGRGWVWALNGGAIICQLVWVFVEASVHHFSACGYLCP